MLLACSGFAHVATMLTQQGIEDPLGEAHLARTLVQFFEGKMVRPSDLSCPQAPSSIALWLGHGVNLVEHS